MGGSIRTNAAAAMLGVSPNTLRSWERRFGFPEPKRTAGGHRQFDLAEIEALRAAFEETQNISSAVATTVARRGGASSKHVTSGHVRRALLELEDAQALGVIVGNRHAFDHYESLLRASPHTAFWARRALRLQAAETIGVDLSAGILLQGLHMNSPLIVAIEIPSALCAVGALPGMLFVIRRAFSLPLQIQVDRAKLRRELEEIEGPPVELSASQLAILQTDVAELSDGRGTLQLAHARLSDPPAE